jgi:catechol 2,3-dioxygenase-like lactoylglutathione lyase family enzyme
MVPAKDFDISLRFYVDLGFQSRMLTDGLAEMTLGTCSFLLQDYYVQQWADNFVIHLFVSDLHQWWDHVVALDLGSRYGVKTRAPHLESWGVEVAGVIDPAGVLWRIHQIPAST